MPVPPSQVAEHFQMFIEDFATGAKLASNTVNFAIEIADDHGEAEAKDFLLGARDTMTSLKSLCDHLISLVDDLADQWTP